MILFINDIYLFKYWAYFRNVHSSRIWETQYIGEMNYLILLTNIVQLFLNSSETMLFPKGALLLLSFIINS